MVQYLLTWLLFLSLAGGLVTAVLFLLLRLSGCFFSQRIQYRLWLFPLILFFVPVTLSLSSPAISPATERVQSAVTVSENVAPAAIPMAAEAGGKSVDAQPPENSGQGNPLLKAPQTAATPAMPVWHITPAGLQLLFLSLWLTGVILLSLRTAFRNLRFRRFVRRATRAASEAEQDVLDQLRRALRLRRPVSLRYFEGSGSPFLVSLFCPTIFLPEIPLTEMECNQVFTHELLHCKRWDLLFKRLTGLVCALHWFNPLSWLLRRELGRCCELSCDEAMVSSMDWEARRSYGNTILKLTRGNEAQVPAAVCLAAREMKHRLEVIMNGKLLSRPRRLLALMLALCICMTGGVLASGVNARNPNRRGGRTYEATAFYLLQNANMIPSEERTDGINDNLYLPGSGYCNLLTGTATLTDTWFNRRFSAHLTTSAMYSMDRNPTAQPDSTFEIEMTKLVRVLKQKGEWVGCFTIRQNGAILFENAPGRLEHVPSLEGTQLTELTVGEDGKTFFYVCMSFGLEGMETLDGLSDALAPARNLMQHADTRSIETLQKESVVWDGYTAVPYFQECFYMNDTLRQAYFNLTFDADGIYTPRSNPAQPAYLYLRLEPKNVTYYSGDKVKGLFYLDFPNGQDREVRGTVTGLEGGPGGLIAFRSDDGTYQAQFVIQPEWERAPLTPTVERYSRFSESQLAEMLFHDTAHKTSLHKLGTDAYPFEVTLSRDAVTLRYTGDETYTAGVTLQYCVFTEDGRLTTKTQQAVVGAHTVTLTIPKDVEGYIDMDLYQVRTLPCADMRRYSISLALARDSAVVYDVRTYFLTNESYSGEAAKQALSFGMAPTFLFAE